MSGFMQRRLLLFVVSCFLVGTGAFIGSVVGNIGGKAGLFGGALIGGLLAATASGPLARARGWIAPERSRRTSIGAVVGFLLAALVATQTFGSPIVPLLSTALIGLGAILGAGQNVTTAFNER